MQLSQLLTNQCYLKDIYSSSSKIFIASQDKPIFLKTLNIDNRINIYEFKYERESQRGTITLVGQELNNNLNLSRMKLAPNFCLGMLGFSEAGKEELVELAGWWSARSSQSSVPPLIELNTEQETTALQAEFWQHMYARMEKQTYAIAARIATLQKQYLGLRTLHENMQNAFAAVEDYLSQAKLPSLQLVFDNQPTKKLVEPTDIADSNSLTLKQLLPVASRGIAVVELHVAKKNHIAVGYLIVQLKACEDETCFAQWQIPYQQLPEGWLSLDLPSIDMGRKRDVELVIEWNTIIGCAPSLSLAQVRPIPEVRAYSNEVTLEHSLAFRIWNGLPGTRKVTSPYLITTDVDAEQINLGYLGQGAMARVREVTPNLPTDKFAHIQVINDGAKILTHPRTDKTPTIAMLPFCFPPGADILTAKVATEHEEASMIEYAMAIITPETDPKTCLNESSALAFSGWVTVEPNIPRQISVELTSAVKEHCHIVIAARLAESSLSDYGWAHWLNFCTSARLQKSVSRVETARVVTTSPDKKNLRDASLKLSQNDFVRVQEVDNGGKIQIHPSYDGETVGILPGAVPKETIKVKTARVVSASPDKNKLRDASLKLSQNDFVRVQEVDNGGKIQVHPSYDGETVGILPGAVPKETIKVKTIVCTENEEASAVEYAVAVINTDDDAGARLAVTSSESALGFSGWHRVEPNNLYQLDVELPYPTAENCHLVLATRLPEDGYPDYAWARWLDFHYVLIAEREATELAGEHI